MSDNRYITGLLVGGLTYFVSFALIAILTLYESHPDWTEPVENEIVGVFDVIGWVFYSSHLVGINGTIDERAIFHPTLNIVLDVDLVLPGTILFFVVPILCLLIAGTLITVFFTEPTSADEAAIDGATLVFAYLPLSLMGALVFSTHAELGLVDGIVGPDPGWALLVMGIIYPSTFGSIGGTLGYWLTDRD